MKQELLNNFRLRAVMFVALMCAAFTGAWAEEVTYTFTTKSWTATLGGNAANWTSGKDGAGFSNNGIQVTTSASGANGTSPVSYDNVSKIVVTYNTNKSKGAGSIVAKIGDNDAVTNNVAYSSGDGTSAGYTTEFTYETPQSGNITLTVNTTTNSIYLVSVAITYSAGGGGDTPTELEDNDLALEDAPIALSFDLNGNATAQTIHYTTSSTGEVSVEAGQYDVSCYVDNDAKTISVTPMFVTNGPQTVTVNQAADDTYKAGSVTFTVTVTNSATYTVSFNAGDGTFVSNNDFPNASNTIQAGTYTLPSATPASGYTFDGWTTSDNDTPQTGEYTVSGDVAFIAHYTASGSSSSETLTFDVRQNPGGWPTANSTTLTNYTYTLNNVDYTFSLKNAKCNSGYLMLTQPAALGLPAREGYKLTKVVASNTSGCSTSTQVGISSSGSQASYIDGGATQTWSTTYSSYTYNLTSTEANTMYYLYVTNKNAQILELALTYEATASDTRLNAELAFSATEAEAIIGQDFTAPTLSTAEGFNGSVVYTSSNEAVAQVNSETGAVEIVSGGTTVITATFAGNDDFKAGSASYTLTVTDPNAPGTADNPYTVAEAIAATPTTGEVYIKGIVSSFYNTNIVGDGSNYRYYISDDGGTETQLLVYKGKGLNNEAFADADDLLVGDEVVIYGKLTTYQNAPEIASGNYLTSLDRPVVTTPTITATPASLTGFTYVVGNGPSAALSITIGGANLTDPWSASLDDNSDFEFSFQETDGFFSDSSIGANSSEPNQTVVIYVRLKSGLAVGDYTGTITITSQGAETVTVNLSGSVTAPVVDYATLPFIFDGGKADIENTDGLTQSGLDSDYGSSPKLKFNGADDVVVLKINEAPGTLTFDIKGNSFSGGTFKVQTSEDGTTYEDLATYDALTSTLLNESFDNLSADVRYIKWIYTEKVSGNVALGNIALDKAPEATAPVWSDLPTPTISVGEDYELHLTQYVSGYPTPAISLQPGSDIADFDADDDNYFHFTPTAEGYYEFTFFASNEEGGMEAILAVTVTAATAVPSVELSETTIDAPADDSDGTITVTYNNITLEALLSEVKFYEADGTTETTYSWMDAEINTDNNVYYVIEQNTDTETRTAYLKVWARDDNNNDVYSELITITQAAAEAPVATATYALYTGDLVEGDYIIFYDGKAMNTTVESSRLQYAEVTPQNDKISTDNASIVWHIAPSGEYWTIYNADADAYAASTGAKNKAQMLTDGTDDKALWTVSGTDTYEFTNKQNAANNVNAYLRNNGTYGFACYAEGTGGALSLYKRVADYSRTGLTVGNYGTICLKKGGSIEGAVIYSIAGVDSKTNPSSLSLNEETTLEAGVPYIFKATATTINAYYTGDEVTTAGSANGLIGSFGKTNITDGNGTPVYAGENPYVLKSGKVCKAGKNVSVGANKAYIDLNEVPENTAGGAVKLFIDADTDGINGISGEIRTDSIYNIAGQRLQRPMRGINIVNGKKVIIK